MNPPDRVELDLTATNDLRKNDHKCNNRFLRCRPVDTDHMRIWNTAHNPSGVRIDGGLE